MHLKEPGEYIISNNGYNGVAYFLTNAKGNFRNKDLLIRIISVCHKILIQELEILKYYVMSMQVT